MDTVAVDYRQDDGWHIFTSEDVPTLLVASPDRMQAYNDVAIVLAQILLLRDGIECKYVPEMSAEEFFGQLESSRVVLREAA